MGMDPGTDFGRIVMHTVEPMDPWIGFLTQHPFLFPFFSAASPCVYV